MPQSHLKKLNILERWHQRVNLPPGDTGAKPFLPMFRWNTSDIGTSFTRGELRPDANAQNVGVSGYMKPKDQSKAGS